ncbi:MAG: glycosyltransferase [Pseudomonadota bacterium]
MPLRPRVAVIYHMFPHYRAPVMRALAASSRYRYEFHGSHDAMDGILPFAGDETAPVHHLGFKVSGAGGVFTGLWKPVLARDVDALILIGNPNFLQTWLAAALGRMTGKRVLFWTHGWLRRERGFKGFLRKLYYGLSDGVLVYADRARDLAVSGGFPGEKVFPIYNSLDWDASQALYEDLSRRGPEELRASVAYPASTPVIICTARLTPLCRFDLLLDAAAILKARGRAVHIALVGDGPSRAPLEEQAERLGLDVQFTGAIYDEQALSRLLYAADVTVSPGKIGLTAMHSLSYGTPVVTHGDLDNQMPEVEAVTEAVTGAFFQEGDAEDLARAIGDVLDWPTPRSAVRDACRDVIRNRYTPDVQVRLIDAALDAVFGGPR